MKIPASPDLSPTRRTPVVVQQCAHLLLLAGLLLSSEQFANAGVRDGAPGLGAATNQEAAGASDTGDISDPEKLAVCSGEFMWLSAAAKDNQLPEAAEFEKYFFWFQARSEELLGRQKAMAVASLTWDSLNQQAGKSGMRDVMLQEAVNTGQCAPFAIRLIPRARSCFDVSVNSKLGAVPIYNLKCNSSQATLDAADQHQAPQANAVVSGDRRVSLIPAPGWTKFNPGATNGIPQGIAGFSGRNTKQLDMLLVGPQSSTIDPATGETTAGTAMLIVSHLAVGAHGDFPSGVTLDAIQRQLIDAETEGLTDFRPEPTTEMQVDSHRAVAWQGAMSVNGATVRSFEACVVVGSRVYRFFQVGGPNDSPSLIEDVKRMLGTVKFQ